MFLGCKALEYLVAEDVPFPLFFPEDDYSVVKCLGPVELLLLDILLLLPDQVRSFR